MSLGALHFPHNLGETHFAQAGVESAAAVLLLDLGDEGRPHARQAAGVGDVSRLRTQVTQPHHVQKPETQPTTGTGQRSHTGMLLTSMT